MPRVEIDEEKARELAEQVAHELFEIQERKFKEIQEEMDKKLDDLGLRGSPSISFIPEAETTEEEIADELEYALVEGESDRFEVK